MDASPWARTMPSMRLALEPFGPLVTPAPAPGTEPRVAPPTVPARVMPGR
jgi:hypothetical protein